MFLLNRVHLQELVFSCLKMNISVRVDGVSVCREGNQKPVLSDQNLVLTDENLEELIWDTPCFSLTSFQICSLCVFPLAALEIGSAILKE